MIGAPESRSVPLAVIVNGIRTAQVDATDRGLQYGDGVFETMPLRDGGIRFWSRHRERLARGCARLSIEPPPQAILEREIAALADGVPNGIVKLIVTRGAGSRGYGASRSAVATRVLSLHDDRETPTEFYRHGVRLRVCETRLGRNRALAGIKHLNRIEQVLARLEADDAQADEGLMLDDYGRVISGTMSNVFLVHAGRLVTPALEESGVEGVMRGLVIESAAGEGIKVEVRDVHERELEAAGELFVTNALIGIWPVRECTGRSLRPGRVTRRLMRRLIEQGVRECAA